MATIGRHYFPLPRFLFLFILLTIFLPVSFSTRHHHHNHRRLEHFSNQMLVEEPVEGVLSGQNADGAEGLKSRRASKKFLHCAHGTAAGGRCMCEQGYAGTWCEREMQCAGFERTLNGSFSCTACKPNFTGARCERIVCHNGGTETEFEQKCTCAAPYSGTHCDQLVTGDVYYFYNNKVATIGPLGLLSVLPMIGIYVVCERLARKRQVRRIEKTWGDQAQGTLNPAHIELLLKEKITPHRH